MLHIYVGATNLVDFNSKTFLGLGLKNGHNCIVPNVFKSIQRYSGRFKLLDTKNSKTIYITCLGSTVHWKKLF